MRLNKEEERICKKYSARDKEGYVHCHECPLKIPVRYPLCKKSVTAAEWQEHIERREEY